jgi:NADP-dependent 3-hydroxy acid dehydrogenase YdfG
VLLTPVWDVVGMARVESWPAESENVAIIGASPECHAAFQRCCPTSHVLTLAPDIGVDSIADALSAVGILDHIVWCVPEEGASSPADERIINGQQRGVLFGFRLIKALLKLGYGSRAIGWTVLTTATQAINPHEALCPTHASVHGLVGSVAKEYPNWKIRLLDVGGRDLPLPELLQLPGDPEGNAWAYRAGEWYRQKLLPTRAEPAAQKMFKEGGVYVVIGGAGGIGEAWTEYMVREYRARVVWIGRREKDSQIQSKVDRLATIGPSPHYIAADASDWLALERARREIKGAFGQISGIVHSAIVLLDKGLASMDERTFQAALSAKVDISVRLAQVFAEEKLDFVLFFSSMLSFGKSAGQSNYAAGCTFKDSFAQLLGRLWPCSIKTMNWGYWGSTGVVATKAYKERMARLGIGSLEAKESMLALEALLAAPQNQLAFTKTTRPLTEEDGVAMEEMTAYPQVFPSLIAGLRKFERTFHGEEGLINGF